MNKRMLATLGLIAFAAVGLGLGLAGCGTDRQVAPASQVLGTGDDQWARVTSSGLGPAIQGGSKPGGGDNIAVFSMGFPIDGDCGGIIPFGRYILTFPPGAFKGTKTITVESDNAGFVECRLYPEGLKFKQPVRLSMLLAFTNGDAATTTIYWYDPVAGSWVDMMGTYDPLTHSVTTTLQHFSIYRAGRAGW